MSGPGGLLVTPEAHEWSLDRWLVRLAREHEHPLAERLELVVDERLELPFRRRLHEAGLVVFLAQDPLGPLYPDVYRYALELERACDEVEVPLVGRAEALSQTCKSRQLQLLRRAGVPAPRAVRLSHWRDALDGTRIAFPLVLRYDCGHASNDLGFAGPFHSADELIAARLPERDGWPARRAFAGLAAVEFVDVRSPDGLYRKPRTWVFGDEVVRNYHGATGTWFGHEMSDEEKARHRPEHERFMHADPLPEERELTRAAARATGCEIATVDYGRLPDGGLVVWEVNPYPSIVGWWGEDPVQQRSVLEAFARFVEERCRAS